MRRSTSATLGMAIAAVVAGCMPEDAVGTRVSLETCATGLMWTSGDMASSQMYPGRDCISCHASRGQGPAYGAAGTIFARDGEQDDCYGVGGAVVELHDNAGRAIAMTANSAGNFWAGRSQAGALQPFRVLVRYGGRVLAGTHQHTQTNCAGCHSADPGGPGRIVVP